MIDRKFWYKQLIKFKKKLPGQPSCISWQKYSNTLIFLEHVRVKKIIQFVYFSCGKFKYRNMVKNQFQAKFH